MNKSLKPVWMIFAVLCAVVAVSVLTKALRPKEVVPWRDDFAAATDEARRGDKPVFAYFTAVWCGPCQSLKHTTWADKNVEAALRDFVPVKVDVDKHPELARRYNVDGVPSFAVLRDDGQPARQTVGALPPDQFLAWLKS